MSASSLTSPAGEDGPVDQTQRRRLGASRFTITRRPPVRPRLRNSSIRNSTAAIAMTTHTHGSMSLSFPLVFLGSCGFTHTHRPRTRTSVPWLGRRLGSEAASRAAGVGWIGLGVSLAERILLVERIQVVGVDVDVLRCQGGRLLRLSG